MSSLRRTLPGLSRRHFLQGALAASFTAASYRRVLGANDRVGVGFIGYGLIGKRHVLDFQAESDVDLRGVAEVHRGRMDEAVGQMKGSCRGYRDFRSLLDDKGIDAVVVSTPDHWHALQGMMACAAGKDLYVEKPLTLFVREGRWMLDVAAKHHRVVQVGTQQERAPLPQGEGADRRRSDWQDHFGSHGGLSKHHAGLWQSGRCGSA